MSWQPGFHSKAWSHPWSGFSEGVVLQGKEINKPYRLTPPASGYRKPDTFGLSTSGVSGLAIRILKDMSNF